MPARESMAQRYLAALSEQRSALGQPAWAGRTDDPGLLGHACVMAVLSALGDAAEPRPAALRASVRYLLDVLAAQAPGRAVEVRVPPYAAVQCVEGPRHTRGTPPNVVETDPLTWIRLAAGLSTWAGAMSAGKIRASGIRADLTPYLPLVKPPREGPAK